MEYMTIRDRTHAILTELEAVRENLLALSDDIWLSIDHNDHVAMEEGVAFKRTYNTHLLNFSKLTTSIAELLRGYTAPPSAEPQDAAQRKPPPDNEQTARIIRELDREQAVTLEQDFSYKRPYGFILNDYAMKELKTWRQLYQLVCEALLQQDAARFAGLVEHPDFISNRGNRDFSYQPTDLRDGMLLAGGIYAESNLSANGFRDRMQKLLQAYDLPPDALRVYLRQDRNAG